jgi:hypothetical protein
MVFQGDVPDYVRHLLDISEKPAFIVPHQDFDASTDWSAPVS